MTGRIHKPAAGSAQTARGPEAMPPPPVLLLCKQYQPMVPTLVFHIQGLYQQPLRLVSACLFALLNVQETIDSVLLKCDGHLFAVGILANALKQYSTQQGWQNVANRFSAYLNQPLPGPLQHNISQTVFAAISASLDSLKAAPDPEGKAAVEAFNMLRHVVTQQPLPLPVLQLLWSVLYPAHHVCEVEVLLKWLVHGSLMYKPQVGGTSG